MDRTAPRDAARISTGTPGLDDILGGGLPAERIYLVEGDPGTGKTTLALQFLMVGRERGQKGLYVTLSETREELESVVASHGWTLDGIDVFELASADALLSPDREMTLLHPWEIELGETVKLITDAVDRSDAMRVVFDSLSEMRLLAQEPLRFRRQILGLKQFFAPRRATVLLLDDRTTLGEAGDPQLHSLSHGVISLERRTLDYGVTRRQLEVRKLRGSAFREGLHDYAIETGGLRVYPRLAAADHEVAFPEAHVPSGVPALDRLLAGGPMRGTSTLVTGPAGAGKTTLTMQFAKAAADRGERVAVYEFDERRATLMLRQKQLGSDIKSHVEAGRIVIRSIDPALISPGEFAHAVRDEVESHGARMVVIDSLNGYLTSMPQEKQLMLQVHELLAYLALRGVTTFLVNPQAGLMGTMQSNLNISYVADAVILLRFFEARGRIRKAISVVKNRGGAHEDQIREFRIDAGGIRIGDPLSAFHGVLTGTPRFVGDDEALLGDREAEPRA